MKGIYCYVDTRDDSIVYVGKDSNIDKQKRHKAHHWFSQYNRQPINSILQNNPGRYEYRVLKKDIDNEDDLNELEKAYINRYHPRFNYTEGGEGVCGYKHTKDTKMKIGEAQIGKTLTSEHKKNISEANSKYTLWDPGKCQYHKFVMFREKHDGSTPCKCFQTKYNGKRLQIGMNLDFTTAELIHDLIKEEVNK